MAVRNAHEGDFENVVGLFKDFFPEHNIFQKSDEDIMEYMKQQTLHNGLFIYEDEDNVVGAFFLVQKGQNSNATHKVWKLRHFAFKDELVGKEMLTHAENLIKDDSKTAKVEQTIADNEDSLEFFKTHGYEVEGTLKNHYRWGESCLVLGKGFN